MYVYRACSAYQISGVLLVKALHSAVATRLKVTDSASCVEFPSPAETVAGVSSSAPCSLLINELNWSFKHREGSPNTLTSDLHASAERVSLLLNTAQPCSLSTSLSLSFLYFSSVPFFQIEVDCVRGINNPESCDTLFTFDTCMVISS